MIASEDRRSGRGAADSIFELGGSGQDGEADEIGAVPGQHADAAPVLLAGADLGGEVRPPEQRGRGARVRGNAGTGCT